MADKTARLESLLPEVYAARSGEGMLHRVLDALGSELAEADEAIKGLLPSHWLDYARGKGLDALAATFGQRRRLLVDRKPETDEMLRQRLRTLVPRFTGGGTVAAVLGAVRAALGLPFDLAELPFPVDGPLGQAVAGLVQLVEFTCEPASFQQLAGAIVEDAGRSRLDVAVDLSSVRADRPTIQLRVTNGVARNISVQLEGTTVGLRAQPELGLRPGERLVLETVLGAFSARVTSPGGQRSVGSLFTALDGGPPQVPLVPVGQSTWIFRAGSDFAGTGGVLDRPLPRSEASAFDEDTFDLPSFTANLSGTAYKPLTFDVVVPYFLTEAVERLRTDCGFSGPIFTHAGQPREEIQVVVDATRAAGVRGRVSFSIGLPVDGADLHQVTERFTAAGAGRVSEDHAADEALDVGSVNSLTIVHDVDATLWIGAVFGVSTFDATGQGFL